MSFCRLKILRVVKNIITNYDQSQKPDKKLFFFFKKKRILSSEKLVTLYKTKMQRKKMNKIIIDLLLRVHEDRDAVSTSLI